jgi:catechol 2,3-dioxygenase-like lactoylglutathione lyase family enzyme
MGEWYSRPVIFVKDVALSAAFYIDKLGFMEDSRYEEGGKPLVMSLSRDGCDFLLNSQQPAKVGHGRLFISLDPPVLSAVRAELERRGAPVTDGRWGYKTMIIRDPDGNELFFPYPDDEPA